jgi:hypothetical protein
MRYLFISTLALVISICLAFTSIRKSKTDFKNGDLIFIINPSGQGKAIQLATHSKYTHIGVIFIENGETFVYHAVEPVSKSSLKDFVAMSADKTYEIKRLRDQSLLTAAVISNLQKFAKSHLGKHYDLGFSWDDEKLYCSEYIWKLYKQVLNIEIGDLKQLKSFDLTHPAVKDKLHERYGNNIPLNENMISPGELYESVLLKPF